MSLDILFLHASFRSAKSYMYLICFLLFDFSGLAKKYSALHLGNYSDEELARANSEADRIQGNS